MLPLRRLLDPRAEVEAIKSPILDSVNIPFDELEMRSHELPSKKELVHVADVGEAAVKAMRWLALGDRQASLTEFNWGEQGPGRLWRPNRFLDDIIGHLGPRGAALDLGCGSGRDSVALASHGFDVVAYDWLEDALDRGRDLARRYAPDASIDWRLTDIEAPAFEIPAEFDVVQMFFFLDRNLLKKAVECLKPGGSIVVETFTTTHRAEVGKPRREHLVLKSGELLELLPTLNVQHYSEEWREGRHTARFWAKK